jgi:hypothetical protein
MKSTRGALLLLGALLVALVAFAPSTHAARILAQPAAAEKLSAAVVVPSVDLDASSDLGNDVDVDADETLSFGPDLSAAFVVDAASTKGTYPLCTTCVAFATRSLTYLLNAVMSKGVMSTCAKLCTHIPGPIIDQTFCSVVCDAAGVAGFAKAIKEACSLSTTPEVRGLAFKLAIGNPEP